MRCSGLLQEKKCKQHCKSVWWVPVTARKEKKIHHEGHQAHEESQWLTLRALRVLRGEFFRSIHTDDGGHFGLGGGGDQVGAAVFAKHARVENHVVYMHVVRLAIEMSGEKLGSAAVALVDLLGCFLFREP